MPSRPPGITLLAILLWLAGAAHVIGALQDFGVLPAIGGRGAGFFIDDPLDGIIQVIAAIVSLFLAGGLWGMQSWARKGVILVAAANLLVVVLTQFEGSESWLNALPGLIVNLVILIYARSASVRDALSQ